MQNPMSLTNDLFWCSPSCSMPCHQPSPPAGGSCCPTGGEPCSGGLAGWICLSPPVIPSRGIWLAGGRGCPCPSGEITEMSPHHGTVFLCGALGRRGSAAVSAGWSAVDPCPLQICLSGLGPALLLNAKRHIFMRGGCLSPPACPTALSGLWGIPSLCCSAVGWASGVCQGRCRLSHEESRGEVKRAPAPV